jgi:hypothetical protein
MVLKKSLQKKGGGEALSQMPGDEGNQFYDSWGPSGPHLSGQLNCHNLTRPQMTRSRLQFRRTFRNFVLVFLFVLISEKQQPLFANFDKAAQWIGLTSDINSLYGAYAGKTTLYPGYALHSWRNDYFGYYRNIKFANHGRITRNPLTGDYKYELRILKPDGKTYSVSNETFPMLFIRRREYRCDQSIPAVGWEPEVKFVYNELEDFVLAFFHASPPQKTGFYAPNAPYRVIARTGMEKIRGNCDPLKPWSGEVECHAILFDDWGTAYERFPFINFQYAWPASVWGESFKRNEPTWINILETERDPSKPYRKEGTSPLVDERGGD